MRRPEGRGPPDRDTGGREAAGVVLCVPNKALAIRPFSNQLSQRALPNPFRKKAEAKIRVGGVGSHSERRGSSPADAAQEPSGEGAPHQQGESTEAHGHARGGQGGLSPRDS